MEQNQKPPKRYKNTSLYICIGLALFYFVQFGLRITSTNVYEQDGWFGCMVACVVFAAAAILIRRRNVRAAAACDQVEADQAEAQQLLLEKLRREKDEKEAAAHERQREWDRTYGKIVTKLVGVTFDNEDGSSRQKALKDALANDCAGTLDLEAYDYKGAQAVRVLFEGTQIGNIPQNRAEEVAAVLDRLSSASLNVERFVPDDDVDDGPIYRADLTLVYFK